MHKIIKTGDFEPDQQGLVSFVNPFSYYKLRSAKQEISEIDFFYIDGVALNFFLRFFGFKKKRFSMDMTSLAPVVFEYAIENNKTVVFVGSETSDIDIFVRKIRRSFSNLLISGHREGYFNSPLERHNYIRRLVQLNPDIIVVGMGTPLQEEFLLDLKNEGWFGLGITCGGFFHQTARRLNYYPKFFNQLNIRWVYRIIDEPKLFYRYFIIYPISLIYFIFDVLKYKFSGNK